MSTSKKKVAPKTAPKPPTTSVTITEQKSADQAQAAVSRSVNMSAEGILQDVAALQGKISSRLADVSALCVKKFDELAGLNLAISTKKEELTRLIGQEVNFDDAQAFERECLQRRIDAENQRDEDILAFTEEVAALEKQVEEQKAALEVARKREEEEYNYKTKQSRLVDEDKWKKAKEDRDRAEQLRQEAFERSLKAQEAELEAKKAEVAMQIAALTAKHEEAIKAAAAEKAIALSSLKKDYEHAAALERAASKASQDLAKSEAASLRAENEALKAQVAGLNAQLASAQSRVEVIATKALESASGQVALNAVQTTVRDSQPTSTKKS